jgi:hypothetical protein
MIYCTDKMQNMQFVTKYFKSDVISSFFLDIKSLIWRYFIGLKMYTYCTENDILISYMWQYFFLKYCVDSIADHYHLLIK